MVAHHRARLHTLPAAFVGEAAMRGRAVVVAVALAMAPLGAQAADLVVWWEKGYYAQEDEAIREIVAAFEQGSGKRVELAPTHRERASGQDQRGARGGSAARLRLRRLLAGLHRPNGPSTTGWWISRTAIGALLEPVRSGCARLGDVAQPEDRAEEPCMGCRSVARPTTSTSGRTSWSRRVSPSTTSRASGRRSGRSGATRSSPPCAGLRVARTSGASGCRCRSRLATPTSNSSNSWLPTMRTM